MGLYKSFNRASDPSRKNSNQRHSPNRPNNLNFWSKMKIIPSILTNDLSELTNLIAKAEGVVNRIQIDVIDHKFADNITVDPTILKNINTFLNLDFHLMVKDLINWIDKCTLNENSRIIGQIEEMTNQKEFVEKVMSLGSLAGLGIDLQTPVDQLD